MTDRASARESVRALLEGEISRRTFLSRVAASGVAASSAASILSSVMPAKASSGPEKARRLHNLTGGELMAEFLRDWDVSYVFGLGGSEEVGFLDALVDRTDLHYVFAIHESAVVAMADGYARSQARPAFANIHSVAGTANALGAMVNAFRDRIPLVVTVGRQSTTIRSRNAFLEAPDLHGLPSDYARWTWDLLRADKITEVLRRAFLVAQVPPGGPTFLTISKDLVEEQVAEADILPPSRSRVEIEWRPDPDVVEKLVTLLLRSEAPLLVAGRELSLHGGARELVAIAELLGAPVMGDVPASHAPVSLPTTHSHYGGLFSLEKGFPGSFDLYWSVGGTMFTLFNPPERPLVDSKTITIHSSIDAAQVGRNYPVDLAVTGHAGAVLRSVLEELRRRDPPRARIDARRGALVTHHRERRHRLDAEADRVWNQSPIAPERLASELNRRLDPDGVVVSELATSDFVLWGYLDFNAPDGAGPGRLHVTSAGGVLGWGIGAAIGTKIGYPDRQVALLLGDGSFQFGVQALWSAARYEVPIAIFIFNNRGYQANRLALHKYGGRAAETGKYLGSYLGSPEIDNVGIARGYGIDGERVTEPDALGPAIDRCFDAVAAGLPWVLDVGIQDRFAGAGSTWHASFSVGRGQRRQS
ncbi:MAG: thiamine pyrophosphate-binding protein [Thermoanaerobaculia bacterium]